MPPAVPGHLQGLSIALGTVFQLRTCPRTGGQPAGTCTLTALCVVRAVSRQEGSCVLPAPQHLADDGGICFTWTRGFSPSHQ